MPVKQYVVSRMTTRASRTARIPITVRTILEERQQRVNTLERQIEESERLLEEMKLLYGPGRTIHRDSQEPRI